MIPSPRFGESLHVSRQLFSVDFLKDVVKIVGRHFFLPTHLGRPQSCGARRCLMGVRDPVSLGRGVRGDGIHSPKPARHHLFAQTPHCAIVLFTEGCLHEKSEKRDAWRKILIPHEPSQCWSSTQAVLCYRKMKENSIQAKDTKQQKTRYPQNI